MSRRGGGELFRERGPRSKDQLPLVFSSVAGAKEVSPMRPCW